MAFRTINEHEELAGGTPKKSNLPENGDIVTNLA